MFVYSKILPKQQEISQNDNLNKEKKKENAKTKITRNMTHSGGVN